jgi:hypothetical protein
MKWLHDTVSFAVISLGPGQDLWNVYTVTWNLPDTVGLIETRKSVLEAVCSLATPSMADADVRCSSPADFEDLQRQVRMCCNNKTSYPVAKGLFTNHCGKA